MCQRCVRPLVPVFLLAFLAGVVACSSGDLLKIPFLSVSVKVVDENDQPVPGAIVEVTNGDQFTTGTDGTAELRFGALGVHQVTVMAQDRVPSTFTVSMPMDRGKTMTARLGVPVEMSANINVSANLGAGFSSMMMGQIYPMLFQSLFVAQGYSMELAPFQEGQWTEWQLTSGDDRQLPMRKAFLKRLDNGQEWWQVRLKGEKPEDTLTLEVLFAKDRSSIRRMRQKTGKEAPSEVPVTEGWYSSPMALTSESLEGAVTQRGVSVTVPAGTFTSDRLEFAHLGMGGGSRLSLWRVLAVPGGVAQAELADGTNGVVWASRLSGHGSGAATELGSY